jgi:hypothetical protein
MAPPHPIFDDDDDIMTPAATRVVMLDMMLNVTSPVNPCESSLNPETASRCPGRH